MANVGEYLDYCGKIVDCAQGRGHSVQILGGLTALTLAHASHIDGIDKTIVVPDMPAIPTVRPNGSRRDVDVLVLSRDSEAIADVKEFAEIIVDGNLETSVFGLRPLEELYAQAKRPFGRAALTFVSDRFVEDGFDPTNADSTYWHALFPFAVEVPATALETWTAVIGSENDCIPTPGPMTTVLNYALRSISGGPRHKDSKKWLAAFRAVQRLAPEQYEGRLFGGDGDFTGLRDFSCLINGLRQPWRPYGSVSASRELSPNSPRLGTDNVLNHPACILTGSRFRATDCSPFVAHSALAWARTKSRGLAWFERHPGVVGLWQRVAENLGPIKAITGA